MSKTSTLAKSFDKKQLPFGTSLARQIAKQNLSNLNNVYWVGERSHKLLMGSFAEIPMPAPGPGVHGAFGDEKTWKAGVDEFRVWRRQHALISAASLLEVYVKSASIAAFSSSPELIDRSLAGLDSSVFLKYPDRNPKHLPNLIEERTDSFTIGTWKDRFSKLQRILGSLPDSLLNLETELQSIQNIRNRIAHSYGVNGELRRTPWEPMRPIEVTPKKIEITTKTIFEAVKILDESVFGPVIGGFEMLHEFAIWQKKKNNTNNSKMKANQTLEGAFRDYIGGVFGRTPGREYNESMIAYYNSIS